MNSLLFYDKFKINQKRDILLFFGLFVILESSILLLFRITSILLWLSLLGGVFCLSISMWRFPKSKIHFLPLPDIAVYLYFLITTVLINIHSFSFFSIRESKTNIDVNVFSVGLAFFLLSIVFPSVKDTFIVLKLPKKRHFRDADKLPSIKFGYRRCVSAFLLLAILGLVSIYFIIVGKNVTLSIFVCIGFATISVWCFEYIYGYRSYILRIFGRTLFICVIMSILLTTDMSAYLTKVRFYGIAAFWGFVFLAAAIKIWYISNPEQLVKDQQYWHSLYIVTLGIGHYLIYNIWIGPFLY
jgi:hypothetical protein